MAARASKTGAPKREVPQAVIIACIVVLVLILGAGGFYAYNGGWKTAGQQKEAYEHEMMPIMAAKHGDNQPLEEENKLRQQRGQAPLQMPKGKKEGSKDFSQKLADLQQKLRAGSGGQ